MFPVSSAKKVGFANENHGARARLVERLYHNEIILGKAITRVDQDYADIAPWKVCYRLLRARNRQRAKTRRIHERDAFCQTIGRQLNKDACNMLLVAGIFLLRRKLSQL